MSSGLDLAELSRHLKQERLFVTSERDQLQGLFDQVQTTAEQLYHQSWIGRQQKSILDALIRSSRDVTPAECCSLANQLESSIFVDAYKHLSYHDSKYGEFLKYVYDNPTLLGNILAAAEKANVGNTQDILHVIMHSVYGNCVLQEDEAAMLQMLKCLLELQLVSSDNPRRLLQKSSCSFSIAFKQLFDVVFSAKLFLTAALHDPVMRLLMEDEWFYDIDPGKALVRFPPQERLRRFGEPDSEQYAEKLSKYRATIVDKLVIMATRFVTSIKSNMHCFPPALGWLVSQVYQTLTKTGKHSLAAVRAVCADMVFALFICPAICDPEPHGITTDVPISHIARHNLFQVASIIQVLAISQWEEIDPKVHDLYGKFEKGCMSSLLDSLLDGLGPELPTSPSNQLPCLARTSSLIRLSQLNTLISFLKESPLDDSQDRKALDVLLQGLTPAIPATLAMPTQHPLAFLPSQTSPGTPSTPVTPGTPGTPSSQKKFKGKKKLSVTSMTSQVSSMTSQVSMTSQMSVTDQVSDNDVLVCEPDPVPAPLEDVLVLSLGTENECPGMMSEQKVLLYEMENTKRRRVKYQGVPSYDVGVGTAEIQEKRTRFSLSHDQESIGNTSDIQEGISEGASSHSVGSQDLENDDDNDNFSDMISANVSGRGTPNISGRDTPLSQAESVEQETPLTKPALPETVQKTNREDVTDKFGKFDIKRELELGDDFKSTVSDTWSTDVLASDSEPPEMNQQVRLEEIAEEMVRQHLLATQERVSEMSETASDAWSTDVLASDTDDKQAETLSEFDQDDMCSGSELGPNLDDVRSECDAAEGGDIPPLAAAGGFQSAGDTSQADRPDVTQSRPHILHKTGGNVSMSPTLSDNVFADSGSDSSLPSGAPRHSRNVIGNQPAFDSNRLFVPIKKKRAPSPPGTSGRPRGGASMFSTNRGPMFSNTQNQLVNNYVLDQQPVPEAYNDAIGDMQNLSLASATNILIAPDSGVRPKSQLGSGFNSSKEIKNKKNLSNLQLKGEAATSVVNSDVLRQNGTMRASADSGIGSVQLLGSLDSSVDVGLSEQQNTKLDETRFTNALSFFDPLSPENQSTDLLEGAGSPTQKPYQEFLSQISENSEEPLMSISGTNEFDLTPINASMDMPPLNTGPLEFGNTVFDQLGTNSQLVLNSQLGTKSQLATHNQLTTNSTTTTSPGNADITPVDGHVLTDSVLDRIVGERMPTTRPLNGDIHGDNELDRIVTGEGMQSARRPSIESSESSQSSGSKDGFGSGGKSDQSSLDNTSQNIDYREIMNGEDGATSGKKRGFFKTFKDKIHKGMKKKGGRPDRDFSAEPVFDEGSPQTEGGKAKSGAAEPNIIITQTSDDILAKYRKKSILTSTPNSDQLPPTEKERRLTLKDEADDAPLYDPNNLENCLAFLDAKRKLRMVLSSGDFQLGTSSGYSWSYGGLTYGGRDRDVTHGDNNDLVNLLRAQLSEAINLQNKDTIAQLHEALRCVRMFDNHGCKKLVRSLQDDYHGRSSYVSYLVRCRQGLLSSLSHLQRLLNRVRREKEIYEKHMTNQCVRLFLENWEKHITGFSQEFQKLTVSDEKTDLVERFLLFLYKHMDRDVIWQEASEGQVADARLAIERYIMSRIYTQAMFPNGDGDILRDQLYQQHIKELSRVISPTHKDLRIPRMYHLECPWPAAQREIYMINAYKTPKDKLQCVLRCSTTIMNLLSMANEKSVPAADDFMPVFIFVIIKANPPCLLSTIEYVNSFYGNRLQGEEQYWWMQFSAAVMFIKTMNSQTT